MNKKLILSLGVFALIFTFLIFAQSSFAQSIDPCPRSAGGDFNKLCDLDKNSLTKLIRSVITILFIIATVASLFFLIFGGLKWITSGGDKGKIEESRNMIIAAAVGLIITFLSYFILNLILNLFGLPNINNFIIPSLVNRNGIRIV